MVSEGGCPQRHPRCCPSWVFLHEKAYQVRDTAIESSVVTKVKGVGRYAGQVMDTADYVTPPQVRAGGIAEGRGATPASVPLPADGSCDSDLPQGTSVFVVVTKQIRTEEQEQGVCPEVRGGRGRSGGPLDEPPVR